jgi:glucose-1-phosphate thymidylyltransferase
MRRAEDAVALTPEQAAAADQGLKAMIPVGRPFLDFILSGLADAGIEHVCLVVAPDHEAIRRRYRREVPLSRLALDFAIQAAPRGTADAVLAAQAVVGEAPFLMVNSDNLYPVPALRALVSLGGAGLVGYDREALIRESNIDRDRIARFAVVWTDAAGRLTRIVEKPDPAMAAAPGTLISMNSWRFGPAIFEACRAIAPSPRGELEIQDAVGHAMTALGERFTVVPYAGGVLDLSHRGDIAGVAARVRGIEVRL